MSQNKILVEEEELEDLTEEEYDEINEYAKDLENIFEEFNDDLDKKLNEINNSALYEKLGIELNVEVIYDYSHEKK